MAALGRLIRRLATGPDARALRRIAEAATVDDPAARPSAAKLVAELPPPCPMPDFPTGRAGAFHAGAAAHDLRALVAGARPDRGRRRLRLRRLAPSVGTGPATELARPRRIARADALVGSDHSGVVARSQPGSWGRVSGIQTSSTVRTEAANRTDPGTLGQGRGQEPERGRGRGRGRTIVNDGPDQRRTIAECPFGSPRSWARSARLGAIGWLVAAPWASPGLTPGDLVSTPALPTSNVPTSRQSAPPTSMAAPSTTRPAIRTDCSAPTSVLVADIDADGCLDALRYSDGVLEANGLRWALGQSGDQLATGDWSCRGTRTIVLLRPSTGEVFRFEAWAVGIHDSVSGTIVATVPGGQAVRAADVDHDGCHELVVERGELPPQVVRLPRPPR